MEKNIEYLEGIALNTEKFNENFILIKEQFTEFREEDKIKINFKECHVAVCPNGGLIAICKKKRFFRYNKRYKNKQLYYSNASRCQKKIFNSYRLEL